MSADSTIRLSQLEVECIKVLWRKKAASVAEVRSGMARPLAYTTVMTVLDRMMDKGAVIRRKNGRAYVYSPALDLQSARRQAVQRLIENLFDQDPSALIQFVSEHGDGPGSGERRSRSRKGVEAPAALRVEIDDSLL
ncbi:MAG: BlaI/MecI/CopY family transcriptional regulator [Candidatus Korobacteraceae bacterium]